VFPANKDEFIKLAQEANLISVYQEYSAVMETPLSLFLKLKKEQYAFLLESVEGGIKPGRYSFIGVEPALIFQAKDGKVTIEEKGNKVEYRCSDPLEELEKLFHRFRPLMISGLPAFHGGAVGYLGYDMVRYWEQLPPRDGKDTEFPDCFFIFTRSLVVFDHVRQTISIVVNVSVGNSPEEDYYTAVEETKKISAQINKQISNFGVTGQEVISGSRDYIYSITQEAFCNGVKKAKEYIKCGDIFQVVLSRRTEFTLSVDPLVVYCTLRHINPSPYMFFLSFGDICLVGSSPELLVKVEEEKVELRPIAGTRPRGNSCVEDAGLAQELLADEKERAEHLMLVDLGRNDLGRVCTYGSVKVEDYMHIEYYSHVMHIVSQLVGHLSQELTCFDVIRAAFPAGTVSGAPKIRAMEIIDELEPAGRGPYAGAVGYFGFSGNMDTCITIRTLFTKGNRAFVQAGAGIVADSDPDMEYQEVCYKAQALLRAVEMAERGELRVAGN
jgi:anthranilate synthase component 1